MSKLTRILIGVAMLLGAVAVMPSPANAGHGTGPSGSDPSGGAHEEMANAAIPTGNLDVCLVTGAVLPGTAFSNPTAHNPNVNLVNQDPSHSHFTFEEAVINCPLQGSVGELAVDADGGNDGHMIDVDLGYGTTDLPPCGGPDGTIPQPESISDCIELDGPFSTNQPQHDFNAHHGSVNESAWSNSSRYVQADDGAPESGDSNACAAGVDGDDQNKFNIDATPVGGGGKSEGWGKYIRVGTVVYTWGCFNDGAAPADGRRTFGAALVIVPNPLPIDPTNGLFPASPLACVLEPFNAVPVVPDFDPCGFILVGAALRGTGLMDL
jgi:hypothetical protein